MNFEYFITRQVGADIDIENIGDCCIKAFNDEGLEYILIIETQMGICRVLTCGPIQVDFDLLPKSTSISFQRVEFRQGTLIKIIEGFLNNPYAKITQAIECTKEEALADCKDLIAYMNQEEFW